MRVIKNYELEDDPIGTGGFGEVYRAWQQVVNREVAIKVILPVHANQDDFIERFEIEAQLIAKLEHPHIVPLYDFWRDPTGAYLVMRWLQGGNLADSILLGDPWSMERTAELLNQIASALHMAHRKQVVHQDIKPANILLDENGFAYLTDFGIARDLSTDINLAQNPDNVMLGSPKYISPEHLKRTEITAKSDIYSLGLLIYEVLTGEPPFAASELLELLQMHLRRKIPSLQDLRPDLPEALNAPILQATAKNPVDRYDNVLDFARDFNQIVQEIIYGGTATSLPVSEASKQRSRDLPGEEEIFNPYKGLAAFQESDAQDFFGRDALTKRLLERMIKHGEPYNRFLAVVGPSGSGKSSVVRAGVIPAIREGAIAGTQFFIATMTPGANPMRNLEGAVLRVASRASDEFLNKLAQPLFDLHEVLDLSLAKEGEMLLIIDQFEEVFTLVPAEETRRHFLQTVFAAVNHPNSRVRLIVTMRADFTDRPLSYNEWGAMFQERLELVPPMSDIELREAIERPALRVGLSLQARLADQIIADVRNEVGSLPLLQYTLSELYERREGLELTNDAYDTLGGISGALAKRADELYFMELNQEQQQIAERILPRLVKLGEGTEDTRRRTSLKDLYSALPDKQGVIEAILNLFQKGRLLTFGYDEVSHAPTVEVAHEALIRRWQLLRDWLNDNRMVLRLQEMLANEAVQWTQAERSPDYLARGDRLAQFRQLDNNDIIALSQDERDFLDASLEAERQAHRRRQRRIALITGLAIVATIAAVIAGALAEVARRARNEAIDAQIEAEAARNDAIDARNEAIIQRDRADEQATLARSRELAVSALRFADTEPDRAALLSLQAIATSPIFEARNSLLIALQSDPHLLGYFNAHTAEVRTLALSPDGSLLASGARDGEIIIWDVATRTPLQHLKQHTERVNSVAFSPDGFLLASTGNDGQLLIWDTQTWKAMPPLTWGVGDKVPVGWSVAFTPDSTTIALGDNLGNVVLWDAATGSRLNTIPTQSYDPDTDDAIYAVAYSPDGTLLAAGGADNVVMLWDTQTQNEVATLEGHTDWIFYLTFSPNGRILASSGKDTTIKLWDTQQRTALTTLNGHLDAVRTAQFTPDGRRLVSGDQTGRIIVWSLFDRETPILFSGPESSEETPLSIWSLVITGNTLLVAGETDSIFVLDPNRQTRSYPFKRIIGTTEDIINALAFSDDGSLIASGGGSGNNFDITLWDAVTGETQILHEHNSTINDIYFDGERLVSVDADGLAVVWENGRAETPIIGNAALFSVALHDNRLALGDAGGTIAIWDISGTRDTWHVVKTAHAHSDIVTDLDFSADGSRLLSASRDSTLKLWNTATMTQIGDDWVGHSDAVLSVAFSPDGTQAASGSRDNTIILWEVASGKPLDVPLVGNGNWVTDVAFSPDGTTLVSASRDATLRLWDVASKRELGLPFTLSTQSINAAAFSPDGHWLASGGNDSVLALWNTDLAQWQADACTFANRTLSATERRDYFTDVFPPVHTCPADS